MDSSKQFFKKHSEMFRIFATSSRERRGVDYTKALICCTTFDYFKFLKKQTDFSQGPDSGRIQNLLISDDVIMMDIEKSWVIERLAIIDKPENIKEIEEIINRGHIVVMILTESGFIFEEIEPYEITDNVKSGVQ